MSSAELPDADVIEQQIPLRDGEAAEDHLAGLPPEVDPADAMEQHRVVDGDDAEDYPPE